MSVNGPLYMVGFAGDDAFRAEFPCRQLHVHQVWFVFVILVVLVSLLCRDGPPENNSYYFRASTWHTSRYGNDHVGTAHTDSLVYACTSAWFGLRAIPSLSLFKAVSSDDSFSEVVAAYGAVTCFVEVHCDVPVSPGEDGAQSRFHEVVMQSSWVRRPPPCCNGR